METKKHETRVTTSNPDVMIGMYIAEPVKKIWKESFVDTDTGETAEIERFESLFNRGTYITNEKLTEINFYLQTGEIQEITVSNQKREGIYGVSGSSIYIATVRVNNKNRKVLLYATDIEMAVAILKDYFEQKVSKIFYILGVKGFDWATVLRDTLEKDADEGMVYSYYQIKIKAYFIENKTDYWMDYIVHTSDTNKAISLISKDICTRREASISDFEVMIEELKELPVSDIIDFDFCSQYANNDEMISYDKI